MLTGGAGLLALNWAVAIRDEWQVTLGLHRREVVLPGTVAHRWEFERPNEISRALDAVRPNLIVHTAGITSVEACEADPDLAFRINVTLAANVAAACAKARVPLIHVSTDHLFSGGESLVSEDHPLAPRNVYGRTKAEAEVRVLDAHPGALVIRTNFYGWGPPHRRSFSDLIIDALRERRPVTLFRDVFYTPILAPVLADAAVKLCRAGVSGIVHVVGDDRLSKYDFGMRLARQFELDTSLIRSGLLRDQRHLVQRPADMSLSNRKACRLLGENLGGVDAHVALLQRQDRAGLAQELQDV